MRKLLKKQGFIPDAFVTDKLPSYGAALKDLGLSKHHDFGGRKNNRAENSHLPVRQRNDECNVSNRLDQRSDFSLPTPPSTILQRPTPSDFPKNITAISQRSDERVADRNRCRLSRG